jgi:hypothetical protein
MVTDLIPATDPAKVTLPETGARTADPCWTPKSTPQCPPYDPIGAYPSTIGPSTGATRQTAPRTNPTIISPPLSNLSPPVCPAKGCQH